MKKIYFLYLICISVSFSAQKKQKISDFSPDYFLEIISNTDNQHNLNLFDSKSKKLLISMNSTLAEYDFEDTTSNVVELPYGHQSIVIFDDFNFDGKKDIALKDGNNSCYNGPSYQVYLFTNGKFLKSKEFTKLASDYCGFFSYDAENKAIHTMTKDGCCWHEFSKFSVINNKPVLQYRTTEEFSFPFHRVTEENFQGGKHTTIENKFLDVNEIKDDIKFYFETTSGKKLYLTIRNQKLHYFFTDENNTVDLDFSEKFFYSKKENSISFDNKDASYKIFFKRILVKHKGKTSVINAKKGVQTGSIGDIYHEFKINTVENLEIVD